MSNSRSAKRTNEPRLRKLLLLICLMPLVVLSQPRLDSMLGVLKTHLPDSERVKTYNRVARVYINTGRFDSAYRYAALSLKEARQRSLKRTAGFAASTLGQFFGYRGKHDSCFHYYDIAMRMFREIRDSVQIAAIYNNIGNVYKQQGNIDKALENYFVSLKLKEKLNDETGIANVSTNIGNLYSLFDDTANTRKFLMKGLALRLKLGDSADIGNSYTALGLLYCKTSKLDLARKYLLAALRLVEAEGDEEGVAIACYNLGNVFYLEKNVAGAEKYYLRALRYAEENKDYEGIASCYEILGKMNCEYGDLDKGIRQLLLALEQARISGITDLQCNINEALSHAYEKKKDFSKALMYYKDWRVLRDSMFNAENVRKLTSSELKYQHEAEKRILKQEQEKRDAVLRAEATTKNILLGASLTIVVVIGVFAWILFRRLQVNRLQKNLIEEQNHEIRDSIHYAKSIQTALLGDPGLIAGDFGDHFICYLPKDIVSGDFYWTLKATDERGEDMLFVGVCDCTGHGVPGAFMSLLIIGFLNEAVVQKGIYDPGEIFNYVRRRLESSTSVHQKDGMDGILLRHDRVNGKNYYAAAHNAPMLVSGGKMQELPFDKMPVGRGEKAERFRTFEIDAPKNSFLYLYTDGFADQFGGPNGKKFKYKQLNDLLLAVSGLPGAQQAEALSKQFVEWKGALEQVDDVCVLGLRI